MLSFSSFFAVLLFLKWFIQSSEIHVIVLGTQWKKILLNQPKIILFYVARPFTDFEMFAILFPEVRWKNAIEDVLPEEEEKEDHFFHFRLYTVHTVTQVLLDARGHPWCYFGSGQPGTNNHLRVLHMYVLPKASVERAACLLYAIRQHVKFLFGFLCLLIFLEFDVKYHILIMHSNYFLKSFFFKNPFYTNFKIQEKS